MTPFYAELDFWLYAMCAAIFTACFVMYGLRSRWRSSGWIGWALLTLYGSLSAILGFVMLVLSGALPEGGPRDVVRSILLGGVAIAGALHLSQILRLQRLDESERVHPRRRHTD